MIVPGRKQKQDTGLAGSGDMKLIMENWRKCLKEQHKEDQALEDFEMAEKVILAFFQSANQGIELAGYLGNESGDTLSDIFTKMKENIKYFSQVKKSDFKGKMPDQLKYIEKAMKIGEQLLNIAHLAGWESWMPMPNDLTKAARHFAKDFDKAFRRYWFENIPEQEKQWWLDWLGGDL